MDEFGSEPVNRREAIKRGAAMTTAVWSLPVIASVRFQAAQGSQGHVGACSDAFLAGGPNGDEQVCVDDDMQIFVNGVSVFNDNNFHADCFSPISLGPLNTGDQIRVTAVDSFGNCRSLTPLYLHCPSTGQTSVLDANGFPEICDFEPPQTTPFYDQTFTV